MRSILKNLWHAIFSYPQRSIGVSSHSYDEYWEARGRTEVRISPWQKERTEIMLRLIHEGQSAAFTVVDVGCGDGAVLQYIREAHPFMKGVGVDFSETVLDRVKQSGFETELLDVSNPLSVTIPRADYVVLFEVIEHIRDSEVLIEKSLASATKGVCISIPNSGYFTNRLRLLFGKFPMQWVVHPTEHLRFWTLRDVHWWLTALGWRQRAEVYTYQGIPILKSLLPSWFAAGIVLYITS